MCSFDRSKSQFFKSLNAIFSKVGRFASEEVVLYFQEGHPAEIAPAHQNSPTLHPPRSSRRNEGMYDFIRPLIWFVLKPQLVFPYSMHPLSVFVMCGDVVKKLLLCQLLDESSTQSFTKWYVILSALLYMYCREAAAIFCQRPSSYPNVSVRRTSD